MTEYLRSFLPRSAPVSVRERVRSAVGALVGILLTGLVCRLALGADPALPVLIAPMGASAVLLFAVPASPLAQPWSIVGGNAIAALVGVGIASAVPNPFVAAALAVAVAIALMMSARCLHPPSGAVPLTAVLGGPAIRDLGYGFVLWPVGANSLLLLGTALLFNALVGRTYPHRPAETPGRQAAGPAAATSAGVSAADIDAALENFDQVLDVDPGDLAAILRDAERRALVRRSGPTLCRAVMVRDVVAVAPDAPIAEALALLRGHHVKALPVTDERARVVGLVTATDLIDKAAWGRRGLRLAVRERLRLTLQRGRAPHGSVADIMTTPVGTVGPDARLAEVMGVMSRTGFGHLPVVEGDGRIAGIVSLADVVMPLLAEAAASRRETT